MKASIRRAVEHQKGFLGEKKINLYVWFDGFVKVMEVVRSERH